MWCLLLIFLPLLESGLSQPLSILFSTGFGRSLELNPDTEDFLLIEDPAKGYPANDFFGDVQKFFIGVHQFVQHPSSSLNSALNQLQSNAKKNHNKKPKPAIFGGQKVVLDPFGSFFFSLGLSGNFQLTNSIGFTRGFARWQLADS
ncbi:uncharacterized protein LOC117894524 [Drosophila subobscura]|uniref:uncharacterized protein LOC117894524 n=1 Tax=Drosophila subobscura TaxID=7241 RepID=UPI00155A3037|nr:uncharacterized protein LOC117894524 [Drosophila subobscura]